MLCVNFIYYGAGYRGEILNSKELGRRIKELRLARKLTQSEVVGNFITRNMLSQIESGAATPSMKTLEYLARKLGAPVSQLLDSPNDVSSVENLLKAKKAFAQENYELSLSLAAQLDDSFIDEANTILARSYLSLARKFLEEKEYTSASTHARLAAEKAQLGIYASRELRSEALLILDEAQSHSGAAENSRRTGQD